MASNHTPNRKVTGAGLSGALAIILVWAAGLGGVEVPAEVGAAFATVISVGTAYLLPEHARDGRHGARQVPRQVE